MLDAADLFKGTFDGQGYRISGQGKAEITLSDGTKKIIYTSDHLPVITDLCFPKK